MQRDVEQVEGHLAYGLPEIMSAIILLAAALPIMLWMDWCPALVMIVGIPSMWITEKISTPLWTKNFKIYADSVTKMQGNVMKYISNTSVIKALGKEENKTGKMIRSTKDYDYWVKESMAGISVPMGLIILFMKSGVVLVMIPGTYFPSAGQIESPRLILAVVSGGLFTSSTTKVVTSQHYEIVFKQAMEGIWPTLGVSVPKRPEQSKEPVNDKIATSDLGFAYNSDGKVLEDTNLRFPKGSKTALAGASGCGKSTLANLLVGFWKPTDGYITIAGENAVIFPEKQLNCLPSTVQQEVFLSNLSIEENIRIGKPDAGMEEIMGAVKKARIHDFIMLLPSGHQTMAGEAGIKLSGREKQHISTACVILKDAPIIISDEATATVDTENEAYIQTAIDDLSRDKTVIMIAHHLSTIHDADQIVVMDSGRIVDTGRHNELLDRYTLYRKVAENQNKVDNWRIKEVSL